MTERLSRHAVILDADGLYHSEVISDIATIEANLPVGGSYSILPDGTPENASAYVLPQESGDIAQPIEGDGAVMVTDLFEGL